MKTSELEARNNWKFYKTGFVYCKAHYYYGELSQNVTENRVIEVLAKAGFLVGTAGRGPGDFWLCVNEEGYPIEVKSTHNSYYSNRVDIRQVRPERNCFVSFFWNEKLVLLPPKIVSLLAFKGNFSIWDEGMCDFESVGFVCKDYDSIKVREMVEKSIYAERMLNFTATL